MFIVTDNADSRFARIEEELAALRAELEALRAAAAKPDRREYMREYMAKKRAAAKVPNA